MPPRKLLSPGPIEVHPSILAAMATPMISHRGKEYVELHARVKPKLKKLLMTQANVFLVTSSGTGAMEASLKNCVAKKLLVCTVGAFGDRWAEIAKANGIAHDVVSVEWGRGLRPEQVEAALRKGGYDAVAMTHNESSTGVMNPLREIGAVVRTFDDVLLIVDCVSSMAGARIEPDAWGVDIALASVQKAFGLPPGLAVMVVSDRALKRAEKVPNRGYYFDLLKFKKSDEQDQTPETPTVSHIYALDAMLDRALAEGVEARFARHEAMAREANAWAAERFGLFAEEGFRSVTLTCVKNTRGIDAVKAAAAAGYTIADGYGKLKGQTFRIAHMGDISIEDVRAVMKAIDAAL